MKKIIFLGPTLQIEDAIKILPEAMYLPPVRCGDVLRALRLKSQIIAIIDGYFEHTAAVWHKEILTAINSGVTVYGAASMGALRAAELSRFGMIGVGKIYNDYISGITNDDDEVAVLHAPRNKNYSAASIAMVNIRSTVIKALNENIITENNSQIILQTAKSLPYQQRNLINLQNLISDKDFDKFFNWVNAGNLIDQKKLDAEELLTLLRSETLVDKNITQVEPVRLQTQKSVFFRALHNDVMCRPFHIKHELLSNEEQVALAARIFGDDYRFTRRLSYLWSAVFALAKTKIKTTNPSKKSKKKILTKDLPNEESLSLWLQENDCDLDSYQKFITRLQLVENLIDQDGNFAAKDFLIALMRTSGEYQIYRKDINEDDLTKRQDLLLANFVKADPLRAKILSLSAIFWCAVENEAIEYNLNPDLGSVENFSWQFRAQKKLFTNDAIELWLQENDLDFAGFTKLMMIMVRMRFLVLQTNLDAINVFQDNEDNIWWLLDMLRLSGLYIAAKRTIFDQVYKKEIYLKLEKKKQILNNSSAFLFDFLEGFEEFVAENKSF